MIVKKRIDLRKSYDQIKAKAKKYVERSHYEKGLRQMEYAASIAWRFPVLSEFVDDELERMIEHVTDALLPDLVIENSDTGLACKEGRRVVFYNGQIIDNGALCEQYLIFLLSHGYRILFIVPDSRNTKAGKNILTRLSTNRNVEIFIPESRSKIEKIRQITDKVRQFNPHFSFLHFLPNDVVGYASFVKFNNHRRYYIVHNDHTFWLGKGCGDYFLEFRQLGVRITMDKRSIDRTKIVHLPFYPIDSGVSFKGFPADFSNKVVGLSGANLYKYFKDPELKYFHAIKKLIENHSNFVFCLCGNGNPEQVEWIHSFIKEYRLEERFYYLGNRPDFYALVGNIDIMFESYPIGGGLTMLFAINQGVAMTGIGSKTTFPGPTEEYLDFAEYQQPVTFDEFEKDASKLISDPLYRENNVKIFSQALAKREDFDSKLENILLEGENYTDPLKFNLIVKCPEDSDFDMFFNDGDKLGEMYKRAWISSFINGKWLMRICSLLITLRYSGMRSVIARVRTFYVKSLTARRK
ncbi:MAG: hypothetical protein KJO21_03265 [Verrucomicrobiae bacterium]|nr:hypothetical protein [Verrucomicrobiae bacterium]NNJ42518.1 glycosyltransferase [Akkermansiaceae bacterium]